MPIDAATTSGALYLPRTREARLSLLRRRLAEKGGFSLIELLIVIAMLVVVLGGILTPVVSSARTTLNSSNYAYGQQEARTGLDAMVSQIRQATVILSTDPTWVEMNVSVNGVSLHVEYICGVPQPGSTTYYECIRLQAAAGSPLPPTSSGTVAIRNMLNGTPANPVFSFAPDPVAPYYMTATIKVPASDNTSSSLNHTMAFSDGALMRNLNVGN